MERLPTFAELIHAGVPPAEAKKIVEQRSITIIDIPKETEKTAYNKQREEIKLWSEEASKIYDMKAAKRSLTEEIAAAEAYAERIGFVKDPDLLKIIRHNWDDEVYDHAAHLREWIAKHRG